MVWFPWILVGFAGLELDEGASGAVGDGDGDFAVGIENERGGAIGVQELQDLRGGRRRKIF
jgi:hypothetical protein